MSTHRHLSRVGWRNTEPTAGQERPALLQPASDPRSDLCTLLSPPDGTALLKAPAREIKAFLQETEAVVPRGSRSIELCSRAHPGAGTLNLCFR
ncbi:SsgA family sporulation/cell division regulator [Streptomyces mirabilis]|uniref:SsgA family sporulation/cell division regulator n=1 Tax=Streptomyces mirabilis TaxID=68239 RepID=UPI0036906C85